MNVGPFIVPVPSEESDLIFYDALVPVKMEMELVLARLENE